MKKILVTIILIMTLQTSFSQKWVFDGSEHVGNISFDIYAKDHDWGIGQQFYGANFHSSIAFKIHVTGEIYAILECGNEASSKFDFTVEAFGSKQIINPSSLGNGFIMEGTGLMGSADVELCNGHIVNLSDGHKSKARISKIGVRNILLYQITSDGEEIPVNTKGEAPPGKQTNSGNNAGNSLNSTGNNNNNSNQNQSNNYQRQQQDNIVNQAAEAQRQKELQDAKQRYNDWQAQQMKENSDNIINGVTQLMQLHSNSTPLPNFEAVFLYGGVSLTYPRNSLPEVQSLPGFEFKIGTAMRFGRKLFFYPGFECSIVSLQLDNSPLVDVSTKNYWKQKIDEGVVISLPLQVGYKIVNHPDFNLHVMLGVIPKYIVYTDSSNFTNQGNTPGPITYHDMSDFLLDGRLTLGVDLSVVVIDCFYESGVTNLISSNYAIKNTMYNLRLADQSFGIILGFK